MVILWSLCSLLVSLSREGCQSCMGKSFSLFHACYRNLGVLGGAKRYPGYVDFLHMCCVHLCLRPLIFI